MRLLRTLVVEKPLDTTKFLGTETQLTYVVGEFADRELFGFAVRTTPSPAWTP
jgi:hypothetical protein